MLLIKSRILFPNQFFDSESRSHRVGGGLSNKFDSDEHIYPMYSLDNTYSYEELDSWFKRIVKVLQISVL